MAKTQLLPLLTILTAQKCMSKDGNVSSDEGDLNLDNMLLELYEKARIISVYVCFHGRLAFTEFVWEGPALFDRRHKISPVSR